MAIAEGRPAGVARPSSVANNWGLIIAVAVLLAILLMATPAGLPLAGQRMLAVFGFAVVIWVSEALDYAVSAVVIAALMAVLLGLSPTVANPNVLYGTVQGLTIAMSGFGNTALTLVAAALLLAAAMTITGLDRRIALVVLRRVGPHRSYRHRQHRRCDGVGLSGAKRHRPRRRRDPDHDGGHSRLRR